MDILLSESTDYCLKCSPDDINQEPEMGQCMRNRCAPGYREQSEIDHDAEEHNGFNLAPFSMYVKCLQIISTLRSWTEIQYFRLGNLEFKLIPAIFRLLHHVIT
jgi:hypothetical protein